MSGEFFDRTEQGESEWVLASEKPVADTKFPCRVSVGAETIVVLETKDGYRGVEKSCPHQGATWMKGELIAGGMLLKCPLHSYAFRISDGKGVNCPSLRIKVFDVRAADDRLYVRIKKTAPATPPDAPAVLRVPTV